MSTANRFPTLDPELMAERLALPTSQTRLLIDTDAANEIDDQFAIAWALLSPEKMTVEAVTTEPFSFAHHRQELILAEQALESGDKRSEHLVGGLQGWLTRLHSVGKRAEIDDSRHSIREGYDVQRDEIYIDFTINWRNSRRLK